RGGTPLNLQGYFSQWLNSTGIPEFTLEYVTYRTRKGFRIVGKIKQPQDTFAMPIQLRIDTEGNPELKTIDVVGTESDFTVETFGRPKSGGIRIDPNSTLANFRMGEAFFAQKNYQASANAFREALATVPEPSEKWTEVWGHIYLGKII